MQGRAVIIQSLEEAKTALAAAAELGLPVTLLSAEGAADSVGALWFREVVTLARAEFPAVELRAVLDCADQPGHVLAALRHGFAAVRYRGSKRTAATLAAIAREYGAELVTGRIAALDLSAEADPSGACRAWLSAPRRRGR
jgi:fructose/tagatose bisphosphate aldolase